MNISFNLELRLPKQDGTCPIYLRITQNKKKKRISTNISVKSEDFNKKADFGKWIRRSNPKHQTLNSELEKEIQKAKDALKKVQENKKSPTVSNIIDEIRTNFTFSFIEFYELKLVQIKNTKTISYYKHLSSKLENLKEFLGKKDLMFSDIDVSFLKKYESYLMSKDRRNGPLNRNSTISNLRAIRTIVYQALKEDIEFKNPFLVERLKEFKGVRCKLSIDEIKKLEGLELEKDSRLWHTLNYFLFSFYAAGTRFSDVAQLKWKNIQGDRLSFIMDKTDEGHSVILIPKALEILEHYKRAENSPDSFVFPILVRLPKDADSILIYNQIVSKNAMINIDLKKIQKLAKLETKMTFHLSRHSFADILRTKKISIYDISKLLGHSDIKITERYFKGFDNKTSDEALKYGMDF